jgi:hypothetical protein
MEETIFTGAMEPSELQAILTDMHRLYVGSHSTNHSMPRSMVAQLDLSAASDRAKMTDLVKHYLEVSDHKWRQAHMATFPGEWTKLPRYRDISRIQLETWEARDFIEMHKRIFSVEKRNEYRFDDEQLKSHYMTEHVMKYVGYEVERKDKADTLFICRSLCTEVFTPFALMLRCQLKKGRSITVKVPPGKHHIIVSYYNPPSRVSFTNRGCRILIRPLDTSGRSYEFAMAYSCLPTLATTILVKLQSLVTKENPQHLVQFRVFANSVQNKCSFYFRRHLDDDEHIPLEVVHLVFMKIILLCFCRV